MQVTAKLQLDFINNDVLVPPEQDFHITTNTQIESVQDGPEVVTRCKNLTIDAGATWSLTNRCAGWCIVVNGDLAVNGIISANQIGIARASTQNKVYGLYGYKTNPTLYSGKGINLANNCLNTLKTFTIDVHATQNGMGGILKLYVRGNVTIGASGVISANGASSCDGGVVTLAYAGNFINSGTIRANAGSGGVAGSINVFDLQYSLTEYQKSLASGEYIYCLVELKDDITKTDWGKAVLGTRDTGKVFYTSDWGTNWSDQGVLQSSCTVRDFAYLGSGIILAATGENTASGAKLYKTINYGLSWSLVTTLGSEQRICRLLNLGGGIVLAGTRNTGKIYKSTDSGANWTDKGQLGSETNVRSFCDLGNGNVLAGTKGGKVYKSINSGDTWALLASPASSKIRDMLYLGSNIVIAGDGDGNIWRSTNGGTNWTLKYTAPTNLEVVEFKRIKSDSNKILVSLSPKKTAGTATQRHVAMTNDLGVTWNIISPHSSTTTNTYIKKMENVWYSGIIPHFLNVPINHFGAT